MENGDSLNIFPFYMNESSRNEFRIDALVNGVKPENSKSLVSLLSFKPQKNTDGYQNIGIYINQNSQQIGLIANGVNHGYVYNYPSKLKNIYFSFIALHRDISAIDINKEFSIELITDAKKLKNNYPTGTTDICGTKI